MTPNKQIRALCEALIDAKVSMMWVQQGFETGIPASDQQVAELKKAIKDIDDALDKIKE